MTAMQLARLLEEKTTKVYHHVEALEHAGLIELVETRQNRGFVEKWYRAIADDFVVDSTLLGLYEGSGAAADSCERLFLSGLEASLAEARRSVDSGLAGPDGLRPLLYRFQIAGNPQQVRGLLEKIRELVESTPIADSGGDFAVTIAFHPVAPIGGSLPPAVSQEAERS
jgi:hypothetical protein